MESKIWKNLKVRILTITKPTRGPNGWRRLVLSFTKLGSLKAHCGTFTQKDCKPYLFFWVDGKPYFEPKYNVKLKVIKILIILRDNSCVCVCVLKKTKSQLILLFRLFLLLFVSLTVLFDIIHRSHCTISTNF